MKASSGINGAGTQIQKMRYNISDDSSERFYQDIVSSAEGHGKLFKTTFFDLFFHCNCNDSPLISL